MRRIQLPFVLALWCTLALACAPVHAAAPEGPEGQTSSQKKEDEKEAAGQQKPGPGKKEAAGDPAQPYTNEDLERMFGRSRSSRKAEAGSATSGLPAGTKKDEEGLENEKAQVPTRQEAEQQLAAAEARVKDLERRILAVRNPLLPRPQLSTEEAEASKGLDNVQRLKLTQEALEAARKELQEARERLRKAGSGS